MAAALRERMLPLGDLGDRGDDPLMASFLRGSYRYFKSARASCSAQELRTDFVRQRLVLHL